MSAASEKILALFTEWLNASMIDEVAFGKIPLSIETFREAGVKALKAYGEEILSNLSARMADILKAAGFPETFDIDDESQLRNFLKRNPYTNAIFTIASDGYNDDIVSNAILRCESLSSDVVDEYKEKGYYESIKNQSIDEINDIEQKIDQFIQEGLKLFNDKILNEIRKSIETVNDLREKALDFYTQNEKYVMAAVMAYYVIKLVINLFQNMDFPSNFRLKYIQKLIRVTLASAGGYASEEWQKLKNVFKGIDDLMVGLAILSSTYLLNRLLSQKLAEQKLRDQLCKDYDYGSNNNDSSTNSALSINFENDLDLSGSCPIEDDAIIPKEPFAAKIENFTCPINIGDNLQTLQTSIYPDLALKAIIENKRKDKWKINVQVEDIVNSKTVLGSIGAQSVYSPVDGKVSIIHDGSIVLSGISDPVESELESVLTSLNDLYKTQNEIKMFLKDFEVLSLLPIMLKDSPVTESKPTASQILTMKNGMYKQFEEIKSDYVKKKENYDKNIKKITGEDNAKKHAENETLPLLKLEVDNEETQIMRYLQNYLPNSENIAKNTLADSGEFALVEYYAVELGAPLNAADDSSILNPFRDKINTFTKERAVIDGWTPGKIEDKIIQLLKDLEKGTTNGSKFFKKGVEVYEERKKMSDVKDWVNNIEPKKKLSDAQVELFRSNIIFLYDFYFNIDKIKEKFKDLAETDKIKKTTEEGNYIGKYLYDLWKQLNQINKDIPKLEKKLDNFSLLSKYYNIVVNEEEYRVYQINELPVDDICGMPEGSMASVTEMGKLKYWFKYMANATLAHIASPQNWATGWSGPPTKIPFPTIYIPIKAIETNYGVIVFGLTITGVWIYPFVLFVNLSDSPVSPLGDPIAGIKTQIKEAKESLINKLKEFRTTTLDEVLTNIKGDIKKLEPDIAKLEADKKKLRETKPADTRKNAKELVIWKGENAKIDTEKTKLELEKYTLEKKHYVIESVKHGGSVVGTGAVDAQTMAVETAEKTIDSDFGTLDGLLKTAENLLSVTFKPIVLQPYSIYFLATIKSPPTPDLFKKIDDNLDETGNSNITKPILDKFKMSNEQFMTGPVSYDSSGLNSAMSALKYAPVGVGIKNKEALPAYEDLLPINLPWFTLGGLTSDFLYTKFVPKGGDLYGFPF